MFEDVKGKNIKKLQTAPYVSSLVESRLLIAAVICNDMNLLKSLKVKIPTCIKLSEPFIVYNTVIIVYLCESRKYDYILPQNDYTRIHSVYVPRSMANSMTALHYAIRTSNLNAIKLLSKKETAQRVAAPKKYLEIKGKLQKN
jgi:hypothetical protein